MKQKELNEKVALLKDGQIVEIDGDWFRALRIPDSWDVRPCEACNLDCICRSDVELVCNEMDKPFYDRYYLILAHP